MHTGTNNSKAVSLIAITALLAAFHIQLVLGWGTPLPFRVRQLGLQAVGNNNILGGSTNSQDEENNQVRPVSPKTQSSSNQKSPKKSPGRWIEADQLNGIKEQVNLVDFLETGYDLDQFRRTGHHRATAVCPFHKDQDPSLSFDGNRGLYKCFGCGAAGDIFHFVRQYHKTTQQEELPFINAVRIVDNYLSGNHDRRPKSIAAAASSTGGTLSTTTTLSTISTKEDIEKRNRIFAMNQHAAAFYAKCLTLPFAGVARYYLQSRGFVTPDAARAFALGYAPDMYFGNNLHNARNQTTSLVQHLQTLNFTAKHILESGLAIQKRKSVNNQKRPKKANVGTNSSGHSEDSEEDQVLYSSLMDRFRGRLVVPIFDRTGEKVVGFGGRVLPVYNEPDNDNNNDNGKKFKAPKYLNSPETAVFQKMQILYGRHIVMEHYKLQKSNNDNNKPLPVILVEGYMDVLALWEIGIKTAVATMGTGISMDQVNAAARMAALNGGRVVLCLDNDEAGVAAVERLCSGGMLEKAASSNGVQFCVASLPADVKDPGDFAELRRRNAKAKVGAAFCKEVLDPAVEDWSDWYLDRLLERCDAGSTREMAGGLGDTFERVADFLSTFSNPADRTRSACVVAKKMASMIAKDNNVTAASKAVSSQLESDLIDRASKRANEREKKSQTRPTESDMQVSASQTHSALSMQSYQKPAPDIDKLSRKARNQLTQKASPPPGTRERNQDMESRTVLPRHESLQRTTPSPRGNRRPQKTQSYPPPPLAPHFAGIHFQHQSDSDWLGTTGNSGGSIDVLGSPHYPLGNNIKQKDTKPVYFLSNEYLGHFEGNSANSNGLSRTTDQGLATLPRRDDRRSVEGAEDMLLHSMVSNFPDSCNALQEFVRAQSFVSQGIDIIEWSNPNRKWLFNSLLDDNTIQQNDAYVWGVWDLRAWLASRDDAPQGAFRRSTESENGFGSMHNTSDPIHETVNGSSRRTSQGSQGSLEHYFSDEPMLHEHPSLNTSSDLKLRREKGVLATQEHFIALLAANAAMKVTSIQGDIKSVALVLDARSRLSKGQPSKVQQNTYQGQFGATDVLEVTKSQSSSIQNNEEREEGRFHHMSTEDIKELHSDLIGALQEAMEIRHQLETSLSRIRARLIRFSSSTSGSAAEGTMPVDLAMKLANDLDSHMDQMEEGGKWIGDADLIELDDRLGKRDLLGLPIKDQLAQIEKTWGEWCFDDFMWSPDKADEKSQRYTRQVDLLSFNDDEAIRETLEESLERIDNDWKNWED
ncbi:DNA primase [Seminavis robusta]|uniref:DNA primase n=1 Tax=Seminavis robusta TaxID=568900 RepID=A0A9N8DN59_9STRA|nr:DNA primase [Seminavis robusta]|eukprot:Sro229_g093020.1 DNA primase (1265) ;mRNA; f:41364-45445